MIIQNNDLFKVETVLSQAIVHRLSWRCLAMAEILVFFGYAAGVQP